MQVGNIVINDKDTVDYCGQYWYLVNFNISINISWLVMGNPYFLIEAV